MQKSVIIVDDFYDDAMDVRARALELEYPESDDAYYAGRNSREALLTDGIVQMVSHLIGSDLLPSPHSSIGNKAPLKLARASGQACVPGGAWAEKTLASGVY